MVGRDSEVSIGSGDETTSLLDRLFAWAAFAGLGVLVFVAGSLTALTNTFPGPQIARAYLGGLAIYQKYFESQEAYAEDLWIDERRKDKGVTVNSPELAQPGYTLYTSGNEAAAYLIDMNGRVVHAWKRPYSSVAERFAGVVSSPQPDTHVFFRHAHVFPNGDLLAIYEGAGDTPYGYGLIKLDRNADVIWTYPAHAHHQFDIGPDGRIYVLTHEIVDDAIEDLDFLAQPRLEDFLVVLSPQGRELQKTRLLTALALSNYGELLGTVPGLSLDDPLHANSIKYIHETVADNFEFGDEGQLLLSFRELHAIAVFDPKTEEIEWATRGPWLAQHDPDILPNGHILLFDNEGNFDHAEGKSRVIEFDPETMAIVWRYAGTPRHPLASEVRGDQQRLANGNTLITEATGGRIVELTPRHEIAWEFMNPVRGGKEGKSIPIIGWSQRLDRDSIDAAVLRQ